MVLYYNIRLFAHFGIIKPVNEIISLFSHERSDANDSSTFIIVSNGPMGKKVLYHKVFPGRIVFLFVLLMHGIST